MSSPQPQTVDRILSRNWFYEFPLPDGKFTQSYLPESVRAVHFGREQMLFECLNPLFGENWQDLTALDLGCHEGYFGLQLALKGCRQVVGIDARRDHLEHAEWIRQAHEANNLQFVHGDVQNLELFRSDPFDIVLLFGIIYHVPNIVGMLDFGFDSGNQPYMVMELLSGPSLREEIDLDAPRIGLRYPVEVGLVGDSIRVLRRLIPLLDRKADRSWLEKAQRGKAEWMKLMEERGTRRDMPMKPQVVAHELGKRLNDDAIVVTDTGTITTWAARHIQIRDGQMFSLSGNLATMACGLPYAIGA